MTFDLIKKTSSPLFTLTAAALLALAAAACTGDTPGHCTDDQTCQDSTRDEYDPAKPHCHGEGNFCFEGCTTDKDCLDQTKTWYEAGKPICHPGTRDCVAQKPDVDLGPDATDAGADLREGGLDVADLGQDLTDAALPDIGAPLGTTCGTDGVVCASGFCVDKVCCESACSGVCKTCIKSGKCEMTAAGKDPENDCPGTEKCWGDTCDGKGACEYKPDTFACEETCQANSLEQKFCDSTTGKCKTTAQSKDCSPYKCTTGACGSGCDTHGDCITGSLCDRSAAHATGKGICVDTKDMVKVGPAETHTTVQAGISAALAAKKKYVKVAAGTYKEKLSIASGEVMVVGDGLPVIEAGGGNTPAVSISGGAKVTLHGLKVQGSLGGDKADGVTCAGGTANSTLTILESTITDNSGQGVEASYCDVTLRRNTIQSNKGGGADLAKGTLIIVNNVVTDNGTSTSSTVGGFSISPSSATGNLFYNNTVAYNHISTSKGGGVACSSTVSMDLVNTILYKNDGSDVASCVAKSSCVATDPLFTDIKTSDFTLKTGSPCRDKGTATTGVTVLDILGNPRPDVTSNKVDMGAYEAQ